MSDIQERWALVADASGHVREETIPAENPDLSLKVQLEEQYGNGNTAQIKSRVELANEYLMQLSVADCSGLMFPDTFEELL